MTRRLPKLEHLPEELRQKVRRDYNARAIRLWWSPRALLLGAAATAGLIGLGIMGLFDVLPAGPMQPALIGAIGGGSAVLIIMLGLAEPMRECYRSALADNGLCPTCGRDVRAAPGRCPECNAVK